MLPAGPADLPTACLGLQVAAPSVGAEATVDVPARDQHATVGELLGVGPVDGEGHHPRLGPCPAHVRGEGGEARDAGAVAFAQHARQLLAAVQDDYGALAEAMVAVVGDGGLLVPGLSAVFGAGDDLGVLHGVAAHELRGHGESAVGKVHHPVGLEALDARLLGIAPGVAAVIAPPCQDARGLLFVEVAEVVLVDDHDHAAVVQKAYAGGDEPPVALGDVVLGDLTVLEPGSTVVVAGQQHHDLVFQRPVGVRVAVNHEQPSGRQPDDVGVLGEPAGTAPDVEHPIRDRPRVDIHDGLLLGRLGEVTTEEAAPGTPGRSAAGGGTCSDPMRRTTTRVRQPVSQRGRRPFYPLKSVPFRSVSIWPVGHLAGKRDTRCIARPI